MANRNAVAIVAAILFGMAVTAYPAYAAIHFLVRVNDTLNDLAPTPADVPSDDERAELIAHGRAARLPAYWLGPSYRGMAINAIDVTPTHVTIGYGEQVCDTGCWYPLEIHTSLTRAEQFPVKGERQDSSGDYRLCLSVARGVPFDHCGPYDATLYTGPVTVSMLTDLVSVSTTLPSAVRDLRPLSAAASSSPTLPAPDPLPCRVWSRIARWHQTDLPPQLRPDAPCP